MWKRGTLKKRLTPAQKRRRAERIARRKNQTPVYVRKLTCRRCRHRWVPRQAIVLKCPKCKSPFWNGTPTN